MADYNPTYRKPDLDPERPWDAAEQRRIRDWMTHAEAEVAMLRTELWMRHGHSGAALYGDDGEMQCHECLLDFRREPVSKLIHRLHENDWERLKTAGNRE